MWLFWLLLFALPLLGVAFVAFVGLGLWRKAMAAFREVEALSDGLARMSDDTRGVTLSRPGRHARG
jgi:hypothetical protein